jgi:hypothetical protein
VQVVQLQARRHHEEDKLMVALLVALALICFVISSFPRLITSTLINFFNLGVAFLTLALLVSLGGAVIRIG